MSSEGGSRSTHSQNERMYSLIDSVPSIAQQYVVTADRVVVDAVPLAGGFGDDVLYPGVLKTTGMPDCAVLFRRYFGTHAAAITRHEVALLLRVAHKNVLGVVGLVDVSPHESYVLLEGNSSSSNLQTLATGLRARLGTVAFCRQAVQWTLDVAAGLAHMHSNNIFHFNIHASSIIVCGGTAKINASGVAQRLALLDIASPEALQLTPSSDVFGIGCVLCELLTGSAPWGKSTGIALLRPHGGPDVMGLPWADSSIPIVKTLVKQLLHADSRHRGTLVEIIPELQNLLDTVIKVAEPPQPTLSMGLCSLAPGWLDAVDPQPSLLDALLCLIGCPLPVDRTDLAAHHADLNSPKLAAWYHYAADTITKSIPHFTVGSQQWEDACAIMLYTCESPICYMINGMLSQRGRVQSALKHITPMARRLFDAVRRLGTPYTSEAFRVVYADNKLLQQPHSDYKTHFAVGRPVNFYQFASFTTDMERIQSFTDQQ
ncbi:serine-threonine protein kinase, putative, partial [Bodo saltans]